MTLNEEHQKRYDKSLKELKTLQQKITNHINVENGDNILEEYPFLVELPTPTMLLGDYPNWLKDNFNEELYLRPWSHLVYFKNEEDAMAFKLRWL